MPASISSASLTARSAVRAGLVAARRGTAGLIAAVIAVGVELIRLVHAPWLDAFRLITTGALLAAVARRTQ
jgi:hypothetical protein